VIIDRGTVPPPDEPASMANEVIAKIDPGASQAEVEAARAALGATLLETTRTLHLERWSIPDGTLPEGVAQARNGGVIDHVQPNRLYSVAQTRPDDPGFGQLWGLDNTGQTGGRADADIDAPRLGTRRPARTSWSA
jgi:hypothetical protein